MNEDFKPEFLYIPYVVVEDERLSHTDFMVFAVVHWFEKMKEGACKASNKTIASYAKCADSSARDSISRLAKFGYLNIAYQDETKRIRLAISSRVSFAVAGGVSFVNEQINNNNNIYIKRKRKISTDQITMEDKESISEKFGITMAQVDAKIIAIEAWDKYIDGGVKDVLATIRNWIQRDLDKGIMKKKPIRLCAMQEAAEQLGIIDSGKGWYVRGGENRVFETEAEALKFKK